MSPNTVGTIVSIGAGTITVIGAIIVILGASNITMPSISFSKMERGTYSPYDLPVDEDALKWNIWWAHRGMVIFYFMSFLILMFTPKWVFGPTWYTFSDLPHGGWGFSLACLLFMVTMIVGIRRRSKKIVSLTMFGSGISLWVAAFLVAAQGISAHTQCIEAWYMMYVSVDMLNRAAVIRR